MTQVYKATYSNVPVLMSNVNGVSVMRRQIDGWVNATHLLKVADLDKPRRTRILERDVQTGEHEKVQGGYGKYQGTWIPADRAVELSEQFGISELVHDLLTYTPGGDAGAISDLPRAPVAARRTTTGTGQPNARSASQPRAKRARKTLSAPPQQAKSTTFAQYATTSGSSSQASGIEASKRAPGASKGSYNRQAARGNTKDSLAAAALAAAKPASTAKQEATASPSSSPAASSESDFLSDDSLIPWDGKTPQPGQLRGQHLRQPAAGSLGDGSAYMAEFSSKLLDFFMTSDKSVIPDMLLHPQRGPHINQPIDDEGNTAFHWTCAMGQIEVMEALIAAGADIKILNYAGHTPLVRTIMFTNNYDLRSFPKVLDLLKPTMMFIDSQGSTVLHHIAAAAASRSRASSTRYYMEILLSKMSENRWAAGDRQLRQFVNHMDLNGDTALHIAARNYSRKLVKVLLSYHAAPDLPNSIGRTAQEYIWEYEAQRSRQSGSIVAPSSSPPRALGYPQIPYGPTEDINSFAPQTTVAAPQMSPHHRTAFGQPPPSEPNGESVSEHHISEAAARAVEVTPQQVGELLHALAEAFDGELRDKDSDIEQVRQLLEQIKGKIVVIQSGISDLRTEVGHGDVLNFELERLREAEQQEITRLRKTVERTQARDLALTVQKAETDRKDRLKEELEEMSRGHYDEERASELIVQINEMQARRESLLKEIVALYADAGSREKMSEYRRLLALCCDVSEAEVDSLLDGIAQALEDRQ